MRLPNLFLILVCIGANHVFVGASYATTKISLDRGGLSAQRYAELSVLASEVAGSVDNLIPGPPQEAQLAGILCYFAPIPWRSDAPPPITLVGPRLDGEPAGIVPFSIRIALGSRAQTDNAEFAFELSHELTHFKMGPRIDNYLLETFAVAASFEIVKGLGYEAFLLRTEGLFLTPLSLVIQKKVANENWNELRDFWFAASKTQNATLSDRPFQTVGALLLLRGHGPRWARLLNISHFSDCGLSAKFQICSPDLPRLKALKSELRALGISEANLQR